MLLEVRPYYRWRKIWSQDHRSQPIIGVVIEDEIVNFRRDVTGAWSGHRTTGGGQYLNPGWLSAKRVIPFRLHPEARRRRRATQASNAMKHNRAATASIHSL